MRTKRSYQVMTFHTTADAMAMEQFCESKKIPGRLIPVPREISAGCGLAWRMLPEDETFLADFLISREVDGKTEWSLKAGEFEIEIESRVSLLL